MALDLFRVIKGMDIQLDDLSRNANVLIGDGLPGGDGDIQDSAPIGSIYLRTDTETDGLQLYWKFTTINNSSADWKTAADKEYIDAVVTGLSWREPVRVKDDTVYANSAAFPTGGVIDGISLNPGDRVLFSNVTDPSSENVWFWDGAAWSEDANQETDGDAVLVQEGSNADQQWVYNGTDWVLFGAANNNAELGYIRDFIGKTGPGAETPTYSSTDIVTSGDTLETAIGDLDAAIGDQQYTNDFNVNDNEDVTTSIDNLDGAIGDLGNYTEENVVTNGDSIGDTINNIDIAIGDLQDQDREISGSQPAATLTTMDTLAVSEATEAKWLVQVRSTSTPANRRAVEIHALTDGTSIDHTEYAVLRLGGAIPGLDANVAISGTDMILTVNSTGGVDYVVKRLGYSAF